MFLPVTKRNGCEEALKHTNYQEIYTKTGEGEEPGVRNPAPEHVEAKPRSNFFKNIYPLQVRMRSGLLGF